MALPQAAERTAPHFGGISFPPIQVIALTMLVVLAMTLTFVALSQHPAMSGHREQAVQSAFRWELERVQQVGQLTPVARSGRHWELQRRQQVAHLTPELRAALRWELQRRQQAGSLS